MGTKINVLKPELVWIGNRCYRKMPIRDDSKDPEEDEFDNTDDDLKPCEEQGIPIKMDGSKFFNSIWIPGCLSDRLRFMVRKTERQLEKEGTKITLPRSFNRVASDSLELTITSDRKRGILEAYRRIEVFVEDARSKMTITHFVSFPMNFENIQKAFLEFKNDVLENCKNVRGLSENIFQDPCRLHLTVAPLTLLDAQERETAIAELQKCKDEINEILYGNPLTVSVKGIEYMNDDPSEVDVLYAKVEGDEDECLQRISDLLLKKFKEAKFVAKDEDSVKLHITLMNTASQQDKKEASGSQDVRRSGSQDVRRRTERKPTFDARLLLERYADFEFGVVTIPEIHISIRFTKSETGYYMSSSVLNLPIERAKY